MCIEFCQKFHYGQLKEKGTICFESLIFFVRMALKEYHVLKHLITTFYTIHLININIKVGLYITTYIMRQRIFI